MQETEHVLPGEVSHYYYCHTEEIYSQIIIHVTNCLFLKKKIKTEYFLTNFVIWSV